MTSPAEVVKKCRDAFKTGQTKPYQWRMEQLKNIQRMINENHDDILKAGKGDMNKPSFEVVIGEIMFVRSEVAHAINNLKSWMKPKKPGKTLAQFLDTIYIAREPYGVALIISAWNYPLQLSMLPLIGAVAAGNCAVIKPSEVSSHMSALIARLVHKYLDKDCFEVIQGGVEETTELLKENFDYIFFTGSTTVGKIVMKAAAENLTPVTLELGGKSPVYVNENSNIPLVAKRIAWGKFFNVGQTCTAPDYILCDKNVSEKLVTELKKSITDHYGAELQKSPNLARIINERHFKRIRKIIDETNLSNILIGGNSDENDLFIEPTVIKEDAAMKGAIMQQEVFGPLLGFISVDGVEQAIDIINSRDDPLAMYIFSNNKKIVKHVIRSTSCGGVTINDTMMHNINTNLPFGGVGASGTGKYHGKFTYETFSHDKSVCYRKQNMDIAVAGRYPPYTDSNLKQMVWLVEEKPSPVCTIL